MQVSQKPSSSSWPFSSKTKQYTRRSKPAVNADSVQSPNCQLGQHHVWASLHPDPFFSSTLTPWGLSEGLLLHHIWEIILSVKNKRALWWWLAMGGTVGICCVRVTALGISMHVFWPSRSTYQCVIAMEASTVAGLLYLTRVECCEQASLFQRAAGKGLFFQGDSVRWARAVHCGDLHPLCSCSSHFAPILLPTWLLFLCTSHVLLQFGSVAAFFSDCSSSFCGAA